MTPLARSIALLVPLAITVSACSGESKKDSDPSVLPGMPTLAAAERAPSRTASETAAFRNVSVDDASAMISHKADLIVLDVRTPEEFAQGHIEGAVNLNARSESFIEDLAKLDKDSAYLVHCRSGRRSAKAVAAMQEAEFKDVAHLDAGMLGWNEAGKPLVR
ncbi:MAG: rhodanese-like domain-containing protein [Pseudomonadota bacterium]